MALTVDHQTVPTGEIDRANWHAGHVLEGVLDDAQIPDTIARSVDVEAAIHAIPASAAATSRLLRKLDMAIESAAVVLLSDSTGDADTEWFRLLVDLIAERYPEYTVTYSLWDDTDSEYDAATTIQTGTGDPVGDGPPVLAFYNTSVAGKAPDYHTSRIRTMVGATQPDLTLISHGHNENQTAYTQGNVDAILGKMLALTESVGYEAPASTILITSQNPNWGQQEVTSEVTSRIYHEIANMRGYGFVDILRVFREAGATEGPSTYMTDDVHPSEAGHVLWADAMFAKCFPDRDAPLTEHNSQQPSSLLTPGIQLLTNGHFTDFASPPTLAGWTAVNATLTQDATNFESAHAYSLKITSASAAAAYIQQQLDDDLIGALRNRWVCLAVRMFVHGGAGNTGVGRISIRPSTGDRISGHSVQTGGDRWWWKVYPTFVPAAATFLQVRIYADIGTLGTSAVISVDRAILTLGKLPRNLSSV